MKEYVICKSCNYIMEKAKAWKQMPACGVSAKMFIDYSENIAAWRKFILSLDIHPILVHVPLAFVSMAFLLSCVCFIFPQPENGLLISTLRVLTFLWPFFLVIAAAGGLIDGRVRFRRLTTPILMMKIWVSLLFFCTSFAGLLVVARTRPDFIPILIIITAAGLACGIILGRLASVCLMLNFRDDIGKY